MQVSGMHQLECNFVLQRLELEGVSVFAMLLAANASFSPCKQQHVPSAVPTQFMRAKPLSQHALYTYWQSQTLSCNALYVAVPYLMEPLIVCV